MVQLLIIADDFTGALDSGVQFAARGAKTLVVVGTEVSFSTDVTVLVVDAETRHLPAREAYKVVYHLVSEAKKAGAACIYKKTDSALRGNIGAELTAVLQASGESQLPFLPAFPQMDRLTVDGVHLINGVPVAESVFGTDPFEPVRHSAVAELIGEQSGVPVLTFAPDAPAPDEPGILVFDCRAKEDLIAAGRRLSDAGKLHIAAGCAGFAAVLPELLGLDLRAAPQLPDLDPRLLVVCGSVNPITIEQIQNAEECGFHHVRLMPEQTLASGYWTSEAGEAAMASLRAGLREHPLYVIDTNDPIGEHLTARYASEHGIGLDGIRLGAAQSIGHIVGELFTDSNLGTLLITGGDTLLQCMQQMGVSEMEPMGELEAGVVLSRFTYHGCTRYVISKSGGFGKEDLLTKLAEKISRQSKKITEVIGMTYPTLPGLTPDGRLYQNLEMGTVEAVVPPGIHPTCHSPATLELPNGDLLCCWFAGTYEGSADVHIVCARLPKGADRWTDPVDISGDPTRSEQNPSLFYGPDGAVWAMYTAQKDREAGKDNMQFTSQVRVQKSFDGGLTWSDYETMFPREGTFCRQAIQVLSNGRWIFGNWLCTDSVDGLSGDPTAFQISEDQGKTWRQVDMPKSNGRVHANVVELENGHLVAFMRDREAANIYRSESFDWGDSWSEPKPTPLPNNNSSISAVKLQSGRIAIAYNPTCTPVPSPGKAAWPGLRCPVAVALSEDGGLTFPMIRWMERGEGYVGDENKTNNKQYEYPHIMQSSDGRIHLTYAAFTRKAVKYVSFTEEDVMGAKRETVGLYNPTAAQSR